MEPETGTVIGDRYVLDSPVGRGGMATVWRAVHQELDRPVAVKLLHARRADTLKRFLREARAAALVRHRNVVDILDFGQTTDGVPFMVMELLEGMSLADRIGEGPEVLVPELVRLGAEALGGLAAVHDAGIVHRDLKPENIFLVEDADGVYPKILDFGISRVEPGPRRAAVTHENFWVGTPEYMSPEQARGLRHIDKRADIYSMGVILYEALTGRVPYYSENVGDLVVMITTTSAAPIVSLRPDLGQALSDVVERAMARDPGARYQNAREFRMALLDAADRTAAVLSGWVGATIPVHGQRLVDREAVTIAPGEYPSPLPVIPVVDAVEDSPSSSEIIRTRVIPLAHSFRPIRAVSTVGIGLAMGAGSLAILWGAFAGSDELMPPAVATPISGASTEDESQSVNVFLDGVPPGAEVWLDDVRAERNPLQIERDDHMRRIVVRAEGFHPWIVEHQPTADATFRVQLTPVRDVGESITNGEEALPRTRRSNTPRSKRATDLIPDPGY